MSEAGVATARAFSRGALPRVSADALHETLRLREPFVMTPASRDKPLRDWRMQDDDAPILRYLFAQLRPKRHLEFGTWQGFGAKLVLESCDATVWSINLRDGADGDDGNWAYYEEVNTDELPAHAHTCTTGSGKTLARTDAGGFVGRLVHDAQLGHRFNQVYCDSTRWDTSAYPAGFFDSVFIDGGHDPQTVFSDTRKALPLVREGGFILWHDCCPDPAVRAAGGSVAGVMAAVETMWPWLNDICRPLAWIDPSWLLMGVKR